MENEPRYLAHLAAGETVERCWIDPVAYDYVVDVRRLDGSVTEERVSLIGSQFTPAEIALLQGVAQAGGSMKD